MVSSVEITQITAAGVASYGLQVLKNSKWWPFLTEESSTLVKRLYSIATAIGVHTGIGAVWNHGAPPEGYQYQLIINIPSLAAMAVTVWHWIQQFVMQEGWYQVAFNKVVGTNPNTASIAAAAKLGGSVAQATPIPKS
jgi:hypothetical protein